jgi:predicted dehydrogenase
MRIAILGAGSMGEMHAHAYAAVPGVEVAVIFGRTRERVEPVAQAVGGIATEDLQQALDRSIDAVDVCLPTPVHREFVTRALNAGKPVFCETPLAGTLDDARGMLETAKANARLLLVGLLMRSLPAYQHIKAALAAGELGRPIAARAYRLGSYLRPDGVDHKAHYSDPTTELMTFDFDVLTWLFGEPDQVDAVASPVGDGRPGHVFATLRYPEVVAQVEASGVMPPSFPYSIGFQIVGEDLALEITTRFFTDGPPATTVMSYPTRGAPAQLTLGDINPYEAECRYFVDSLRGAADPGLLSAERAIEALGLSVATQQSIASGKPAMRPFA